MFFLAIACLSTFFSPYNHTLCTSYPHSPSVLYTDLFSKARRKHVHLIRNLLLKRGHLHDLTYFVCITTPSIVTMHSFGLSCLYSFYSFYLFIYLDTMMILRSWAWTRDVNVRDIAKIPIETAIGAVGRSRRKHSHFNGG